MVVAYVTVYDPLGGFDNHCLNDEFHVAFRIGYKNAAAISYPKSQDWTFDSATQDQLYNFPCNNFNNSQNIVHSLPLSVIGAAVRRNSNLVKMVGDGIQNYWNDCNYATVIALPLPNGTTENDFHLTLSIH